MSTETDDDTVRDPDPAGVPARPRPVRAAARGQAPVAAFGASPGVLYLLTKTQTGGPVTTTDYVIAGLLIVVPLLTTALALRGTVVESESRVTPSSSPRTATGERLIPEAPRARPARGAGANAPVARARRASGDDVGDSWPGNASREPDRPVRATRYADPPVAEPEPADYGAWTGRAGWPPEQTEPAPARWNPDERRAAATHRRRVPDDYRERG